MSVGNRMPGDPLPSAGEAKIDPAKFVAYSMDASNPGNGGKWEAFAAVGYDVHHAAGRLASAQDVIAQLREQILTTPAIEGKVSSPRLITNWLEVDR